VSYLSFVELQGLSPEGLPLVLLKTSNVDADCPPCANSGEKLVRRVRRRIAGGRTRHTQGKKKLCKLVEDIEGKSHSGGVALSKREDAKRLYPKPWLAVTRGTSRGM
jgi:hypothetical protein